MKIKSNIIFFRLLCIAVIAVAIYFYNINHNFFGFLILAFTLLLLFSGGNTIRLSENVLAFEFRRLVPVFSKIKEIKVNEIESAEFVEGKVNRGLIVLLNLIDYIPGTIKSDDELLIKLTNGSVYRHDKVGSKKEIKELIKRINEKTQANRLA